jgi:CheY-like chemotaxis protein
LGLSRTSYYRYLAEAIDAVSAILWDRYIALTPTEDRPNTIRPTDTGPIERAVRLSGYSSLQATRLAEIAEIIDDVLRIISPLENQCGITIRVSLPTQFPDTYYLSAGIVRQVLLIVLTEAIQIACNDVVNLIVAASKSEIAWRITQLRSDLLVSMDARVASNMAAAQALLAAHNGRLWSERDERKCFTLGFALPVCHPRTVLIVDDDPDTVELYTRYLRTGPYLVRTARTAQDVRKLLAQDLPDLVVLDVLLPGEDGWNILQQLKTMPETAHIPIIVCSVLSQPLLALALGAKEVLRKPVEQGTFLRAVSAALNLPEVPG